MQDFNNKTAVITGGAGGVGRAIAQLIGKEGAKVVVSDIEEGKLNATVAELVDSGIDAIGVVADVTNQDSMNALAKAAQEKYGELHVVFANAGVGTGEAGNMWEYQENDWKWGFNVNMWGLIHSINAFMPILVEQNVEAHFVATGSGNGAFLMMPPTPIYTATKAAAQAIIENLYFQMQAAQSPVQINALFPGPHVVNTGIFNSERNRPEDLPGDPDKPDSGIHSVDDKKEMMAQFDMELPTTEPEEVAEYALEGVRENKFWIMKNTEKSRQAMRDRFDGILAGTNPTVPDTLGG
jgi:NAD(P)-dependent dehydrogenase (short-subunit alcohol dehydrogenase family)